MRGMITSGMTYVNIHTENNPGGEIRGQIFLSAGEHTVMVSGAKADNYNVNHVNGTLTVTKRPVTATPDPATRGFGSPNPTFTVNYSGFIGGSVPQNTLLTPPTVTTDATAASPAGDYATTAGGGVADNYEINGTIGVLTVTKGVPVITWPKPAPIYAGTALSATQLNATSSVAGSFTYAPSAGTMLPAGPGQTLQAFFVPADPSNYAVPDAASVSIDVLAVVEWGPIPDMVVGTALGPDQLNAKTNVPGTIIYSPSAGVSLPVGTHVLTAIMIPFDTTNNRVTTITNTVKVLGQANTAPTINPHPLPTQTITVNEHRRHSVYRERRRNARGSIGGFGEQQQPGGCS
jgi:hypothetical protein